MGKTRYTTEQIIVKLREIEILCGQGSTIAEAMRLSGITEQTYYHWRKKYSGMGTSEAKRLKELEQENARLKKLVAELSLDNVILKDVTAKKLPAMGKRPSKLTGKDGQNAAVIICDGGVLQILSLQRNPVNHFLAPSAPTS